MRLRQYIRLLEAVLLAEATRYDPMFAEIISLFPKYKGEIDTMINWARQSLKREDRITWFLRWYRLILLHNMDIRSHQNDAGGTKQFLANQQVLSQKYEAQMVKYIGRQLQSYDLAPIRRMQGILSHFLSLPIPALQNHQFGKESPPELEEVFNQLETQWKKEQELKSQHIAPQEGDQLLIPFDDGWGWWLLNRGSCDAEAKAMGHCGNVPSEREGDRILSLRKQGPHGWRPSLTFILNGDGKLGEMKGRGNDKPAPQFHPYIVSLLENPIIHGIRGGGYMPAHNFSISDLSPEEQERLFDVKPQLASGSYLLKKFGPTDEFGTKVVEEMEAKLDGYQHAPTWDPQNKVFIVQTFETVDDFISNYGSDFMKRVAGNFNGYGGESFFDDMSGYFDDRDAKQLFDGLPPETLQKVCLYARNTYSSNEDYEDVDWNDDDEVWDILVDESDDVVDAMKWGMETGYRYGAEHEMYESFISVLQDAWNGTDADYLEMRYTMYRKEDGKEHVQIDGPCSMILTPQSAASLLDTDGMLEEIVDQGWSIGTEIDIDEPRNGWSDYDEEAAKEDAQERLHDVIPR